MPYKYIDKKTEEPKITETKVVTKEPEKIRTEEEAQLDYEKEHSDTFDEDDEIIEVSFD